MLGRLRNEASASAIHVVGLWTIAVAQPVLDLLGRNPDFFVAHQAGPTEILLVVFGLVAVLPAVWLAVFSPGGRYALRVIIAALSCAIAMQVMKQAGVQTWTIAIPVAAASGIAAAVAYHRRAVVRAFATWLALALVVVPAVFLSRPGILRLLTPPRAVAPLEIRLKPGAGTPAPVVLLILDQTPLVSLLDADEKIDPVLYPNLARLARDGVSFRNATTVSDFTSFAVPAIASGLYPRPGQMPTYGDHPQTLFTLLRRTHRLEVLEATTRLCPEPSCGPPPDPLVLRLGAIARDMTIVYWHLLLTDDLRAGLPPITSDWAGFASANVRDVTQRKRRNRQRLPRLDSTQVATVAANWISRDDAQPTFYYLHFLLTHSSGPGLPSGQANSTRTPVPGDLGLRWSDDEWAVAQHYQRHLLQIGVADRIVGRVIANLEAAGLYDRALIVVTADHGISFQPGLPSRSLTIKTATDIMRVPLIVKVPAGAPEPADSVVPRLGGQRVSDRNVETIDLVPTIADALGLELPWKADGVSLLGPPRRGARDTKRIFFAQATRSRSYPAHGRDLEAALRRKLEIFGGSDNVYRVPRPSRFGELVGRPLAGLRVTDGGGRVEVDALSEFEHMDIRAAAVPFDMAGRLLPPDATNEPTYVAVAIDGTVRAVTHTWSSEPGRWLATPPLDTWRDGRNRVEVFVVRADADGPRLYRTLAAESR